MKRINDWIFEVEETNTNDVLMELEKVCVDVDIDSRSWVVVPKAGDLIILNPPAWVAMFRLDVGSRFVESPQAVEREERLMESEIVSKILHSNSRAQHSANAAEPLGRSYGNARPSLTMEEICSVAMSMRIGKSFDKLAYRLAFVLAYFKAQGQEVDSTYAYSLLTREL